jgi:GNAT superfamily N-acetyltransferase
VATPADWSRVRTVRLAALADTPDAFCSVYDDEAAQPEGFWSGRLAAPDRITVIATVAATDVGIMGAGPHHDDPDDALLYSVWVDACSRGGGAATAMLDRVIAWARDRGHQRLLLDVGDHNDRATAFYRRAAFVPTGRHSNFPAPRSHITEQELALQL